MSLCLSIFLASLVAALALTPLAKMLSLRLGVLDYPGSPRKIHRAAVPRLGGLAVCLAFGMGILVAAMHPYGRALLCLEPGMTFGFLTAMLAITVVGVIDDVHGLDYRRKFAAQFMVALVLYGFGFRIGVLSVPFPLVGPIDLGVLSFPISMLWLVGITNAVNLIDGLDGLAAGVSLFALATAFANASLDGVTVVLPFVAALAGATLGFLPYNTHPARIFLGDGGSLLLGSALGALSIRTYSKTPSTMALIAPLVMLGLPLTDTLVAMLRRYLQGRSPFEADREHVHHRLLALGLSHRSAVLVLYGIAAAFSALALALRGHSPALSALGLALGIALVLGMLHVLNYREVLHLGDGLRTLHGARGRARERLLWLKEQHRAWRDLRTTDELWTQLSQTPVRLGLCALELNLASAPARRFGPQLSSQDFAAEFPLQRGGTSYGRLVVAVAGHRSWLLDDERLVYEYLADFVSDALEAIALHVETSAPPEASEAMATVAVASSSAQTPPPEPAPWRLRRDPTPHAA